MLRHLILGLLRHGGPRHGYALMKEYREASGREINVGNFYREFQRLQQDGLVRPVRNPADTDRRRVPYQITELGAAEFDAWLVRPAGGVPVDYENEYSLRAFFVLHGGHALAERVLDHWSEELRTLQRSFQAAHEDALARRLCPDRPATLPLWLERRLRHLAIDLEFVAALRAVCGQAQPAHRPADDGEAVPPALVSRREG
jgi:DNA-binding PadR family transcriptional regulator